MANTKKPSVRTPRSAVARTSAASTGSLAGSAATSAGSLSGSAAQSTATFALAIDSQLIEDYLATNAVLVDWHSPSPIAVFQNANGDCEALVVDVDHNVFHVAREPRSTTGWNVVGLGAAVSPIAAESPTSAWTVGADGNLWRIQNELWTQTIGALPTGVQA